MTLFVAALSSVGVTSVLAQMPMRANTLEGQRHIFRPGIWTAHMKWAKPYAQGKLRVVSFCYCGHFLPRMLIVETL